MNRIFKPISEWPPFREWIVGMAAMAVLYASFFQNNNLNAARNLRYVAVGLCLLQVLLWVFWRKTKSDR